MTEDRSENRVTENKPRRVPVGGQRDILSVFGKSDEFEYRFVKDKVENGSRIQRFIRGGYDFTRTGKDSQIIIGEEAVYKSKHGRGSIIRYPAGGEEFLYLMEIRKEYYEEDQATKMDSINELESNIIGKKTSEDNELGQYGSVKLSRD